jgi:LysR family cyn operon transcriptional activator
LKLIRLTDLATILPENVGGTGLSTIRMGTAFEPWRSALLRRRNAYCSAAAKAFIVMTQ